MENSSDLVQELPFVSILMVNYNGQAHVKEFFESVYALNYPKNKYEVVVVDNASSDGSPDWIEKNYPQVKLIRLDKNTGFAGGNNIGVKLCAGEFIALINNDTTMTREWLAELVKPAVKEPNGLYGSTILFYNNREYIGYGGANLYAWGGPFFPQVFLKEKSINQMGPFPIWCACGCGFLLSKENYLKLGGFDESYFCYYEDAELCWRAWLFGYKVYSVPRAKIYHKGNSTFGTSSHTHVYLCHRNQLRNMIKFPEFHHLIVMIPLSVASWFAGYVIIICLREKKYSPLIPFLKAYFKTVYDLPLLLHTRKKIQKERKVKDRELEKLGLILSIRRSVKYFLVERNRRKEFLKSGNI